MKHQQKKRFDSIDLMRAIAIISMVQIHLGMYLTRLIDKQLPLYHAMNYFGQVAAPFFLLSLGISQVISLNNNPEQSFKKVMTKGLFLTALGLLFINIWQGDILHYIGLYLIISYFLLRLNKAIRTIDLAIILAMAPILLHYIDYMSGWQVLAYKLKDFWTLGGFFKNLLVNGFYPMFPWLFYPVAGTMIGELFIAAKDKAWFSVKTSFCGALFLFIGLALHKLSPWKITFYPATITYMIFHLGVYLLFFGIFIWLIDVKKYLTTALRPILFMGKVALSLYLMHILIGLGYFFYTQKFNIFSLNLVLLYILGALIVLSGICYVFVRSLGDGPLEYVMKKMY